MDRFTIFGDRRSGNCLKVLYTARHLDLSYDWEEIDIMAGESRDEAFLAINPWGQIPAVRFSDGRVLTQSNAITLHLAEGSALIPSEAFARAQIHEWMFWEQYSHEPAIAVRRFMKIYANKADDEIEPKLLDRGYAALDHMEASLSKRDWLVGGSISLADIALVAYTQYAGDGGFDLGRYPGISRWIARTGSVIDLSATP
ncbi:MAG: glutathione S-transferase family protein [Alphaproteobacteria bacterium]|nr:glutathione S-transferase family protein [Alphaproteobacteria bacterium SS10]